MIPDLLRCPCVPPLLQTPLCSACSSNRFPGQDAPQDLKSECGKLNRGRTEF